MQKQEAFRILDLSPSASEEEIKKKYKEAVRKNHPDLNKEQDTTEKLKQINEAYSVLTNKDQPQQNNPFNSHQYRGWSSSNIDFGNFGGFGSNPFGFGGVTITDEQDIFQTVKISFKESIQGCKKPISFHRKVKCKDCLGQRFKIVDKCPECDGKGAKVIQHNNMILTQTCPKCNGMAGKREDCKCCLGSGATSEIANITINIPGGVEENNQLNLARQGNFNGLINTDVLINLIIDKDKRFEKDGFNINHKITLTLKEALQGKSVEVPTLDGTAEINVPPMTRHLDRLELIGKGVPSSRMSHGGNQVIIFEVVYPDDPSALIAVL